MLWFLCSLPLFSVKFLRCYQELQTIFFSNFWYNWFYVLHFTVYGFYFWNGPCKKDTNGVSADRTKMETKWHISPPAWEIFNIFIFLAVWVYMRCVQKVMGILIYLEKNLFIRVHWCYLHQNSPHLIVYPYTRASINLQNSSRTWSWG